MTYLTRDKSNVYHLWDGNNTYCRQWVLGGMNPLKKTWRFVDEKPEKNLCNSCNNISIRMKDERT